MLILTRKTDQGIVFSGNVTIRILSVDGERVKIGIDAPRSVQVLREELVGVAPDQNGHAGGNGIPNEGSNGSSNGTAHAADEGATESAPGAAPAAP